MKATTMMLALACTALLGACANPQQRQTASPPAGAAATSTATAAVRDPDNVICKSFTPTGTRIAKKTCMTVRQWDEAARQSRQATEDYQRSATTQHGTTGN